LFEKPEWMKRECVPMRIGILETSLIKERDTNHTKTIEFELQCQIWASSVEPLRRLADITRFMRFRTVSKTDHGDSFQILQENFREEEFIKARRFLSVHLFKYHKEILKNIEEMRSIYTRKSTNSVKADLVSYLDGATPPPRFMGMLALTAAVLKTAGRDPHPFVRKVCKDQSDWVSIMGETSTHSQLFNDILSAAVPVRNDTETGRTTIRKILSTTQERTRLEEYDIGMAYLEFKCPENKNHKWLVIHWDDALPNLLAKSKPTIYRGETSSRLQAKANRDTRVISYHKARKMHAGKGGFKKYLGAGIRIRSCTIYNVQTLIEDYDNEKA